MRLCPLDTPYLFLTPANPTELKLKEKRILRVCHRSLTLLKCDLLLNFWLGSYAEAFWPKITLFLGVAFFTDRITGSGRFSGITGIGTGITSICA